MVQLDLRGHTAEFAIDPSNFPELKPFERTLAIETWKGRMLNEHASARVFAGLIPQMMAVYLKWINPWQLNRCACPQATWRMILVPGERVYRCFTCLDAHRDQSANYTFQLGY